MLSTGARSSCAPGKGLLADCRTVNGAVDLRNGVGNLRFDTQAIEARTSPTTVYVHEVPDKLHPGWTDIDYWWYLPDNPADDPQGAMCGAGFVIPEITCFDHQSDWEGVTVVVGKDQNPVGRPLRRPRPCRRRALDNAADRCPRDAAAAVRRGPRH